MGLYRVWISLNSGDVDGFVIQEDGRVMSGIHLGRQGHPSPPSCPGLRDEWGTPGTQVLCHCSRHTGAQTHLPRQRMQQADCRARLAALPPSHGSSERWVCSKPARAEPDFSPGTPNSSLQKETGCHVQKVSSCRPEPGLAGWLISVRNSQCERCRIPYTHQLHQVVKTRRYTHQPLNI